MMLWMCSRTAGDDDPSITLVLGWVWSSCSGVLSTASVAWSTVSAANSRAIVGLMYLWIQTIHKCKCFMFTLVLPANDERNTHVIFVLDIYAHVWVTGTPLHRMSLRDSQVYTTHPASSPANLYLTCHLAFPLTLTPSLIVSSVTR